MVRRPRLLSALLAAVATVAPFVPAGPAAAEAPAATRLDIPYGVANGKTLLLDAYVPPSDPGDRRPAVILIHGGGFRAGDKSTFAPEAQKLTRQGWVAFSVNYRLDEPSAFPAELDDVRTAVNWVRAHASEYRVDPALVGVLGESAGGTLGALLATTGAGIAVAVSWSGPMDLVALTAERGDAWAIPLMGCSLSACRDRFEQASPIAYVDKTDAPLMLYSSDHEQVPLAQEVAMAQRLDKAGVLVEQRVLPGTRHALDYRDEAFPPSVQFLRAQLVKGGRSGAATVAFGATLAVIVLGGGVLILRRPRRAAGVG